MTNLGTIEDFKTSYPLLSKRAYEYCRAKGFPAFKSGGTWIINMDKVDEWIEKQYGKQVIKARVR